MQQEETPGPPFDDDSLMKRRTNDLTQSPTRVTMNRGISMKINEKLGADVNLPPLVDTTVSTPSSTTTTTTAATTTSQLHYQQVGNKSLLSFGWLDRHRERRRRLHLQQQAEEQLQKILQAEMARKTDSHPNIGELNHQHCHEDSAEGNVVEVQHPYSMTRNHSSNNRRNSEDISLDDSITGRKIVAADISKSGEGASAQLDLINVLGIGVGSCDEEDNDKEEEFPVPPVRLQTMKVDKDNPFILNKDEMHAIASHVLPKTIAFCRWKRLYGLNRDGDSFDACLRIIGSVQRTLMVIRTTKGEIFGGYADSPWHPNDKGGSAGFYGSAAACLFSFSDTKTPQTPNCKSKTCFQFSEANNNDNNSSNNSVYDHIPFSHINVFRWTGKNRYIQLCDVHNKMIAFGGGGNDGAFGVCIQEDFQRGSTGPCDTFDNDPLCQDGSFDIVDVEFWEFLTGVF